MSSTVDSFLLHVANLNVGNRTVKLQDSPSLMSMSTSFPDDSLETNLRNAMTIYTQP